MRDMWEVVKNRLSVPELVAANIAVRQFIETWGYWLYFEEDFLAWIKHIDNSELSFRNMRPEDAIKRIIEWMHQRTNTRWEDVSARFSAKDDPTIADIIRAILEEWIENPSHAPKITNIEIENLKAEWASISEGRIRDLVILNNRDSI